MFTLSVEWRMGWERSLTTELPNQEKPLRPPPTLIETHLFKEMRAIKATSLHRKVTKSLKSWENDKRTKPGGWRGRDDTGAQPRVYLRDLPPLAHTCTPLGA